MQAKGLIQFFAIALVLICGYQLSFNYFTSSFEGKAKAHAENVIDNDLQGTEKEQALAAAERKFLLENENETAANLLIAKYTYKECKERQVKLGLDLQGGMSMVLQVTLDGVIQALANNSKDPNFAAAINNAKKAEQNSQDDFVTLFQQEFEKLSVGNTGLAPIFATQENSDFLSYNSTNDEVIEFIRSQSLTATQTTFDILKRRIDKFGVSNSNIQLLENQGRILVELPGVDDTERVSNLITRLANLEFWEVVELNNDLGGMLSQANDLLAKRVELESGASNNEADTSLNSTDDNANEGVVANDNIENTADVGTADVEAEDTTDLADLGTLNQDTTAAANDSLSQEEFKAKNPFFGRFIPAQQLGSPILGQVAVTDTAELNKLFADPEVQAIFPRNIKFLYSAKPIFAADDENNDTGKNFLGIYAIESPFGSEFTPKIDGRVIVDARQDFDPITNEVVVSMAMNAEGAKDWAKMTGANVNQSIAIVLDDLVYSAPNVNSEITGGSSQIQGNFDLAEAQDLANILKAGKLPAPARIIESTAVGPTLGASNISAGLYSLLIGIVMVLLFMVAYYSKGGIVSVIALFLNLFFIIGVLASLGATLTLPGMAGIVLTIGMAVDANVIIYERIREELARGSTRKKAIADGFSKSYSAIIDANLTTLITAVILAYFGLGPVLGFATILIIGIFSSLFTAVLITRLMVEWGEDKGIVMKFFNGFSEGAFKNLNIDFVSKRRRNYYISIAIIAVGLVSFLVNGFQLGVDFKGGRTYVVQFDNDVNTQDLIEAAKTTLGGEAPQITTYGASNQVKLTTAYRVNDKTDEADSEIATLVYNAMAPFYKNKPASYNAFMKNNVMSSQKVGPTIADDITRGAYLATIFALIGIFLYIAFRFKKWQFGVAAVVTVLHDTLILLTIFSVLYKFMPFGMEINQPFIAALLTVIGYSINDTVVVFDRIREYLGIYTKRPFLQTVNDAINSTLSRTIITSLTTLFVVLILFIFGGEAIRGFSFALLIGILVGTYSSIFIATPLVIDLYGEQDKKRKTVTTKKKASKKVKPALS